MNKQEFLSLLRKGLYGLPQNDIEERIAFYAEMIDDRIEEGMAETEAVAAIGSVDEIVFNAVSDTSLAKIAKERIKGRHLKAWEIVLLALGSPIWLSLLISAAAVILSIYVSIWAVVISLWATFVSVVASSFGGIVTGIIFICIGTLYSGIATIAAGIVCSGLSIFAFYGCKALTKLIIKLTKVIAVWVKNCCIKKGVA